MTFRAVATVTSVLLFVLGAGYVFAGSIAVGRWGLPATEEVLLVARRIGAIYLGLSVLYFLARTTPASHARTAMSAGAATVLVLLAGLGVYEFLSGRVGGGIFVSAGIEMLLAIGFILVLVRDRRESRGSTGGVAGTAGR